MKIRQLLLILQEKYDIHHFFLTETTAKVVKVNIRIQKIVQSSLDVCHSSFDRKLSCSAHTANPTCAQSFDLHSLQNGIPSKISTITCFFKILSCIDTTILLISCLNCFIVIGIAAEFFSFIPSQRVKALMPSSTLLFLTMVASTLSEAFRLVLKMSEKPAPFDSSSRRLLNMKSDYSNLCLYQHQTK
jgi:hypothetical protein